MTRDQTSLPQPKQKDQHVSVTDQHQEDEKELEGDFIIQVAKHAREEWETFHLQHPDVDEETFVQVQRYCLKQWFLQHGIVLADLPAFEQAEKHFECDVQERVAEIEEITAMMDDPIYWEAQCLGAYIATQAQERSKRAREATEKLSSNTTEYLVGKVHQLRAPGQAQNREQEAQERLQEVRQDCEYLKELGIAREYENQKAALKEREKALCEQVSSIRQLLGGSYHQIDVARYISRCEQYLRNADMLLEDLHLRMLETHRMQDGVGKVPSHWDAAKQRARHAHDQIEVLRDVIGTIQEGMRDALTTAQAEIEHIRKVKQALKRTRKRSAEIEKWAQEEKQQARERKKKIKELRDITEQIVQSKAVDRVIKTEEQLIQAIERARSKAQESMKQLENIYMCLNKIKTYNLKIAEKGVKCVKLLKKGKHALERAIHAAESFARDPQKAFDQQSNALTLLDREEDAIYAEERASQIIREEMEAYAQAKHYGEYAVRYLRDISAEYSNMGEVSNTVIKQFEGLLKDHLPFEQDILDCAITGVKTIVKASMNVLRLEEQAKEAAHQMASGIGIAVGADASQLIANEYKALLLTTLANDGLATYAASYQTFHALAAQAVKEYRETRLETSLEQYAAALEVVKKDVDEMKHQKERRNLKHHATAPDDSMGQAHLLINEQTGVMTLKDGITFYVQDLAQISKAPAGEQPGRSRLWFKAGHPWSSYDVPHGLLHEGCKARTRIHLQVPDGAGGYMAMLCLPNGTRIKVADIDLGHTAYDSTRPELGVTITLKKDGQKINLLAAASVMATRLTPEALRELMDRSLDECIHRLASAVGTKDSAILEEAFLDAKSDDRHKRYIEKYIRSSEEGEKRKQDLTEWMQSIQNVTSQSIEILHEYVEKVLNEEYDEKEITELTVLEQIAAGKVPDELFQKRRDCLQQIITARGFETIIHCQLLQDPADSSAGTYLNPTIQGALMEYERAIAFQQAQYWQEQSASGASDKWASYLACLRRAILDEAPAFFRTKLLIYHIREAVKADLWEQGTAENPGVAQLAQELQARPSAVGKQDYQGNNEYANALQVFIQRAVAGVQGALKTGDPAEILARIDLLDLAFNLLYNTETRVWQALDPMTPTVLAKEIVEPISGAQGRAPHDDRMSQQRASKQRQLHVRGAL